MPRCPPPSEAHPQGWARCWRAGSLPRSTPVQLPGLPAGLGAGNLLDKREARPVLQGLRAFFPFLGKPRGTGTVRSPVLTGPQSAVLDMPSGGWAPGQCREPWPLARPESFSCLHAPTRAGGPGDTGLGPGWERRWVGCRVRLRLAVIGGNWLLPPQECADRSEVPPSPATFPGGQFTAPVFQDSEGE